MPNDAKELLLARRVFVKKVCILFASLLVPGIALGSKSSGKNDSRKDLSNVHAHITEIRQWSNSSYTRITITLNREAVYEHRLLKHVSDKTGSPCIYVDIKDAMLSAALNDIPVGEGLLKSLKISNLDTDAVRLAIDTESVRNYEIFSFYDPFRIVLDIHGERRPELAKQEDNLQKQLPSADEKNRDPGRRSSQTKLKANKIRRIVIDPGHGGKDPGAVGIKGTAEKDVALAIGMNLAEKIRLKLGVDVVMTRTTDVFIPLQERTSIANKVGADLFISIHANASPNRSTTGIESYYLNLAKTDKAAQLAAMENGTSLEKVSLLQGILFDLMANYKLNDSAHLADEVQKSLYKKINTKFKGTRNLGVKQGPFFVLVGATMPSILVETAFLSNVEEEARLATPQYQEATADGILNGIENYIMKLNG